MQKCTYKGYMRSIFKLAKYQLTIAAVKDLEEIWIYTYKNWSFEQADRYYNLIIDEI